MGFRFRKSFKIGPARMTFSKSGVSRSVGVKGFRVTKTAKGKTRTTVSLPRTGLSYTSESGGRKKHRATGSNATARTYSSATKSRSNSTSAQTESGAIKRSLNPPKPPKSPKVYLSCGIIMVVLGLLMLFLLWPIGLLSFGIGVYYITSGPKIYTKLVENYKAVHTEFRENAEE